MKYRLENSNFIIQVESKGAELEKFTSKKDNFEYIWQKDKNFWAKSSPILFPFVGGIKDEKYFYDGKEYRIETKHGFARDNEFVLSDRGENYLEFLFESNEETKKKYPFDFKLFLKYILDDNTLKMEYRVENLTDGKMYFSLGAHPAFNVFDQPGENYIEFEKDEIGKSLTAESIGVTDRIRDIFEGKILRFTDETFKEDAIIFKNTNSKKVWLKSDKNDRIVEFDYNGFEYIAFWSVPKSGFVCLEPWDGLGDLVTSNGQLTEKVGIKKLEKGEMYQKSIEIKIL